jgi:3-(3-hydroxy-phenyl)propionate hydroxylase
MGWAMTAGGRLGNLVRRSLAPRLHLIPGLRTRLVSSSTTPLRRSALIIKSWRLGELAGSICPNPVLRDGVRLDTVLSNGFGLITTTPLDPVQSEELRLRGTTVITAQSGTELAQWLGRGRAAAAIIRPDRAVMQTGRHPAALCDLIPRFSVAVDTLRSAHRGATENT